MEFIYLSLFSISVNLPDQFVTVICDPNLKKLSSIWEWIYVDYYFLLNLKESHSLNFWIYLIGIVLEASCSEY